jgi:integrase
MGDGLFKRGHIWFAWVNGHRVSTGLRDKQAAAKKRDELERRAVDPAYALGREATGQQIFDNYARSRRRLGRSSGTMHHVETKMGNLLRLLPVKCDDWNLAEFEKYVDDRLKEGVRRTTIKKELRVALAALRHARKHHLFDRAPEDIIPELSDDYRPRTRFLTPWELVALVTALDEENDPLRAAHVVFIVATGARWSESLKATPNHVGWRSGDDTGLFGTKTKASRRTVPTVGVSASLLSFVAGRVRGGMPDRPMFAPWPNVRRSLLSACKRAGIAPVSPNDLRRTFATWLQQAGATNELIAKVLGHTTTRMTESVYGKLPAADVARLLRERVGGGLSDEGVRDGGLTKEDRSVREGGSRGEQGLLLGDRGRQPASVGGGAGLAEVERDERGVRGAQRERPGAESRVLVERETGDGVEVRPGEGSGEEGAPVLRALLGASAGAEAEGQPVRFDGGAHGSGARTGEKNIGLLMGSKQVFSGRSEGTSVIAEKAVSSEKNQPFGSAQTPGRTGDTGIFNPPESAANVDESRDSGADWVAGGPPSPDGPCVYEGVPRDRPGHEWYVNATSGYCRYCGARSSLPEFSPVQGPCQACDTPWGLHTSSMKRRCRGDDPPLGSHVAVQLQSDIRESALDLARFARDVAWDAAEQAVRRELIARRRYLPQFVGAVRGELAS